MFRSTFLALAFSIVIGVWATVVQAIDEGAEASVPIPVQTLQLEGLEQSVNIVKDRWGVSHIYAQNQQDLFFAQGYNAARDRLFQFELWRSRATGTLAKIMCEKAFEHDRGARLLRFRGDLKAEMAHYHSAGEEIISAFVDGVNAYIYQTELHPELLPFEFTLLGIRPGRWTPAVVVSRHNALTGGLSNEILLAKVLTAIGEQKARNFLPFYRQTHLQPFEGIDLSKISSDIMAPYKASRTMPAFTAEDLAAAVPSANSAALAELNTQYRSVLSDFEDPIEGFNNIGSNNWVLAGSKTASGKPLLANDPHRSIATPSLRYLVHLNAPAGNGSKAWNVVGAGEPVLPDISIGHNEYGAWGLTIFRIDQEDLMVYRTHPDNPNSYRYQDNWQAMDIEMQSIEVRGSASKPITLKYTVHGPVLYQDPANNLAYGLKAAWLDQGAAPYLASLRMDQATSWPAFREACSFSGLPGENMLWAGRDGTIGWQSVGLSPVRFGWDGSLPVPGDGEYEWQGYMPIKSMPHLQNPSNGWYGTANNFNVPPGYPNVFSDFYSDPARIYRLREVLDDATKHSIEDSMVLQYDNKSMTAEQLTPLLRPLPLDSDLSAAAALFKDWDHVMDRDSAAAALYDQWELALLAQLRELYLPADKAAELPALSRHKMLQWLQSAPRYLFGDDALAARDNVMIASLRIAVDTLRANIGNDPTRWRYGHYHYAEIHHPLSQLVSVDRRQQIDLPRLSRGGASNTLNANRGNRQLAGASFRMIVDTADWDLSRATNGPGQSGDPRSQHYRDLYAPWNRGEYFPLYFSREKIDRAAVSRTLLQPLLH